MPEPSDSYKPTEADIEMVIEDATGKPVKPEDATAGIASMRQRIAELETEKARLLDQMDTAEGENEEVSNKDLTAINQALATARERLAHYEVQLGSQN